MMRIGVALLALTLTGTAWAGCSNYVDGSTDGAAPRAKMCIAGFCEETAQEYSCGNVSTAQWGYLNGLTINVMADGTVAAAMNGFEIDVSRIKCTEIDEGSCFIRPKP